MVKICEGSDLGASINFLLSVNTLYMTRYNIHIRLFCLTKMAIRETKPSRHQLLVKLQQNIAATTATLAESVQSKKLKKQIVGVRARFRLRVRFPGQGSRKSQILSTQTTKMLEKNKQLIARRVPSEDGRNIENIRWMMYRPGGVVIFGSQCQKSLLWQAWNCPQWKCSSMYGSITLTLKRQRRMRFGRLIKRSNLRIELRCSSMGVFFYLKPRSDSNTFIFILSNNHKPRICCNITAQNIFISLLYHTNSPISQFYSNSTSSLSYNNIQMNRQRPYRRSPPLLDTQQEHYRKQLLRSDLSMLQQQNAILKLKCKKVSQLQDKVEMVLKQNSQLLSENEKLSRFLHQQKSDNQVVRNKCETLANQKVAIMGEFELERKKMLRELELLGDRLSEEEALKDAQVNEMRGQYQVEVQNLRRQFQNSENSYQSELRKLREQLDKRDHDLADYANRLKRVSTEGDYEILRLKQEREKLRNELVYVEADHIKEVEALKNKYQTSFQEEVEALKRVHLNNLQEAQLENARLKEGFEDQCRENEALTSKANKQRAYYEDTINYLKRDCEALRAKVVETKQLGDLQANQLREKMRLYHQADIDDLQEKQAMQLRSYQEEIHRLQSINHGKNVEIEQLIKDKVATRGIFDSQLLRIRDQYATLLQRHKDLELRHSDLTSQSNSRLADREKHIEYLQEVIRTQKGNHESESIALQKLVESLKQELSNEKLVFRENEQHLKEELAKAGHELSEAKAKAELEKADYERQITDLKNELSGTSHNLSSRADALTNKNRMIEKENQGLKNNITLKQKEIRNLSERLKASSQRQSKLQAQIDQLRTKMVKREQRANESIGQQKGRLEASFNYALENLKSDHETALRLEANRYKDLQEKLRRKQTQLQQLLRMYKKMTEQIQTLTEQQANKKDLTLKYPGATADLIATKNLFDVYLKTKVLDICGDALKENKG